MCRNLLKRTKVSISELFVDLGVRSLRRVDLLSVRGGCVLRLFLLLGGGVARRISWLLLAVDLLGCLRKLLHLDIEVGRVQGGILAGQFTLLLGDLLVDPVFRLNDQLKEVLLLLHGDPWEVFSDLLGFLKRVRVGIDKGSKLVQTEIVFFLQVDKLSLSLGETCTTLLVRSVLQGGAVLVEPVFTLRKLHQESLLLLICHVDVVLFLVEPVAEFVDQRFKDVLGNISLLLVLVACLESCVSLPRCKLLLH